MTGVKICGLSTVETVDAAIKSGAAFVGFNFFARSPRYIEPLAAAHLAQRARGPARIVAITVDLDDETLDAINASLEPDLIQLHGKETPARAAHVAARTGRGIIKALPVSDASDIDAARGFDGLVEHLMFDARPPASSELPGGVGARFDWGLLAGRKYHRPHFLAGGLDPWNVSEAVRQSGAPLVDVSSGVERGAGIKDPALISAFLDAAKRA